MRSVTYSVQADRPVTVEGKSSVNKLAGFFPLPITTMQEGGSTSSTDVAEQLTDFTEVDKTLKESVPAEQGQLPRAAKPDQGVLRVKTQRQRDTVEFTHSLLGVYGEAADDQHRRRQDPDLENAPVDRTDIAAMTGPNEVTECRVRVGCDRLDEWRFGTCSFQVSK